ncbi:MAG: tRNA nuclease WapA [Luteibacter sp.]|uniref:RHS repeat-associated core domain-containing protein n=1 Tax=Luteibacter sp. TaxID=1886636 RepID=UPI00138307DC|nr:RHS repeat-associated core domain-containing protein [Luteibacter sp.]KAF1008677.1 MAG: tRNA nuclease WapA [Luteibacter sp.]
MDRKALRTRLRSALVRTRLRIHAASTAVPTAIAIIVAFANGAPGQCKAQTVTYYYTDPQGTILATTDAQGNVTATFDHKPFGIDALTPGTGPGFTAHVEDSKTSLIYMQARYYDPTLGRFLSVDPIAGRMNVYAYARNNPYTFIDPSGAQDCSDACMQMRWVSDNFTFGQPMISGENMPQLTFGKGTEDAQKSWNDNKRQIVRDLSRSYHRFKPGTRVGVELSYNTADAASFDGATIFLNSDILSGSSTLMIGGILGHELYHVADYTHGRYNHSNDIFKGYALRARSEVGAYTWNIRTADHYELNDPDYIDQFKNNINLFTPCANFNCDMSIFK